MRAAVLVVLLAAALLPVGFSGCVSCDEGPPVSARDIHNAPASDGTGPYGLQVQVIDAHTGEPLPAAGVVVYWGGTTVQEWGGNGVVQVGPDRVVVEPDNNAPTTEAASTLRLKTGDDGQVRAQVPEGRVVGIVAAKDGWTEEWVPAVATGSGGTRDTLTVPLYRSHLDLTLNGTWGPGAASSGIITSSQYAWDPMEVPFGDAADTNRGYAARIVTLDVALEWENGATSAGDLGLGVGPSPDGPTYFQDGGQNLALGTQTESASLSVQDLVDHQILGASAIQVGAATQTGFLSPFGLDYTLHISADFDTARADLSSCLGGSGQDDNDGLGVSTPGPGLVAVLGLVAVAAVTRRLP